MNETYSKIYFIDEADNIISTLYSHGIMFDNIEYYEKIKIYILSGYSFIEDRNYLYSYDMNKFDRLLALPRSVQPAVSCISLDLIYLTIIVNKRNFILIVNLASYKLDYVEIDVYPTILSCYKNDTYIWSIKNEISTLSIINKNNFVSLISIPSSLSSGGMMIFNGSISYTSLYHINDNQIYNQIVTIINISSCNNSCVSTLNISYQIVGLNYQ